MTRRGLPHRTEIRERFARLEALERERRARQVARRRGSGRTIYLATLAIGVPLVLAILALLLVFAPPPR